MENLKTKSLSSNYILYNLRKLLDVFVPLIIFPYVTRILGPEKLGKVGFAESIIGYFMIFSKLGIPSYGLREIARVRDDVYERSRVFWELSIVLFVTTIIAAFAYFYIVLTVPRFSTDLLLYLVIFPTLIFSNFDYEWIYTAIEDQVFITKRYILVRILQCVLIFTLIRSSESFIIYAGIFVGLSSFSSLFNIFHLRKYISFINTKQLNIKRHIRYIFIIFASVLGIQINRVLDVTMIGIMVDESSVSFYNVANRIVMLARDLILGIVVILNPRIENFFKKGDYEAYKRYLSVSLYAVLLLAIPATVGIILLSSEMVDVIAGAEYTSSILSMQLLSPIIIIVGLANIVVCLVLYPNRRESRYTITVFVSAFTNIIFNFFMIPRLGHNGAILGTVLSEFITLTISTIMALPYLKKSLLTFSLKEFAKYLASTGLVVVIVLLIKHFMTNAIYVLVCSILITVPVYFITLIILKSICVMDLKQIVLSKFLNPKKRNVQHIE